jgi:hypothetical protein
MSSHSNVFSQGGGGNRYEFEVQTAFFISFLIGCQIPGLPDSRISEFRQQAGSLGYATDDLLLHCTSENVCGRILIQIKHSLLITEKSESLKEVLAAAWSDFKNDQLFNSEVDKIYVVKSILTAFEKNHLKQLFNWANIKATAEDFINEINRVKDKKKYFDLFKSTISSFEPTVTPNDIFRFLKCFDVLEYDFGNTTSTSKNSFLSLIDITKASAEINASDIWNKAFTFISDSDGKGGYFTRQSIPQEFKSLFDEIAFSKTEKKLQNFSEQNLEILDFIDDSIGGISLNRQNVLDTAKEKINNARFLIITGDPGVGKSAIAKAMFNQIQTKHNGYTLLFKADQLNENNLRDIFLPHEINLSIKDIFSYFPLFTDNYIYIDAAEKLLEGEGIAFLQLLKSIKDLPNARLIISCRKASLSLVQLKYFHSVNHEIIDVPVLDDSELNHIILHLGILKTIAANQRLLSLIRIPKYLDYAFRAASASNEDYSGINEIEFINKLWSIIIENKFDHFKEGLPARRNKLFIQIAVDRAKSMQPFIKPGTDDLIVLEKLEKDNVLVQSSKSGHYAPAHDVLEDWGLIKFVDEKFTDSGNNGNFFKDLGTEPAMRRAYRLWVQAALKERDQTKINFFTDNLTDNLLDNYWKDESIIAVLNSEYCDTFLRKNLPLLKANNWKLFFQIVHVMRTACRESMPANKTVLVPVGFGWSSIINLIHENIQQIPEIFFPLIFNTISTWKTIIFQSTEVPPSTGQAGLIAMYLLENFYLKKATYYNEDKSVENCLKLIFNFCGGIKEEVKNLLIRALSGSNREENDQDWKKTRYHEQIIKLALSGLYSTELSKHLPDEVIKIAKVKWYRKPRKKKADPDDPVSFFVDMPTWDDVEFHFGIEHEYKHDYFPSSAYQTPVLWLLRNHPFKTIDFITELLNTTTKKYKESEFAKDDECLDIEINMPDGIKIKQQGNIVLWLMYRGSGKVTPHLLQSVLMALERYLLDVSGWGDDYKPYLQKILNNLYVKSETVALTSVIASVCMANPVMVGDMLLPLYSDRKLISWDVVRYTHDLAPLHIMMWNQPYDDERMESDKLQHRTKYQPGLKGFIVNYCFDVGLYKRELFEILDEHRKQADSGDIEWRKILDDMDVRTWKATKQFKDGDKVGFFIEPSYKDEIKDHVEEWNKQRDIQNKNADYKITLLKAEKKELSVDIEKWREIYLYYKGIGSFNFYDHAPGALAAIAIRDIWSQLNDEEKEWSVISVVELIRKSIDEQYRHYSMSVEYSPYDMDGAMMAFPRLITMEELQKEKEEVQKLFIQLLITHYQINHPDYSIFLKTFDEHLWKNAPAAASKYFRGLIAFAKFTQENPFYIDHPYTEEQVNDYNKKYNAFINKVYKNKFPRIVSKFNYTDYSKWVLHKAIRILPTLNPPEECINYLKGVFDFWITNEPKGRLPKRHDEMHHNIQMALRDKFRDIIFWNSQTIGGELLKYLLNRFNDQDVLPKAFDKNGIWDLYRGILEGIIMTADTASLDNDSEKAKNAILNFQKLWFDFETILSTMDIPIFEDLLLLNIEWKKESKEWKPITEMTIFFEKAVLKYGGAQLGAVINLLSHIGDATLLPQGINWLAAIMKSSKDPQPLGQFKYADQLLHRVYDNHLSELRADKNLFENYLWALNNMISYGSSDAYWIREFLISFRHN